MNSKQYMKMLYSFNQAFDGNKTLLISWNNGFRIKCKSSTGVYETDTEPEDDDYIGEYAAAVNEIEILQKGSDNSVEFHIYNNSMEISILNTPSKIELEDGTVLWEK